MLLTDSYALVPGLTAARETYENEFRWGSQFQGVFRNAYIDGSARDVGNSPTTILRPGLVLGEIISSGKYKEYVPTATDGSEVASAVLLEALRMQDFENNNQDRFYAVLVGGPLQKSKLLGFDELARAQMTGNFIFDDVGQINGAHWFPWKRFQTKTANYTCVAADNYSLFDNRAAGGAVTFTLPALNRGFVLGFRVEADQNVTVASAAGDDMIALNDQNADSVAFSTAGERIGGMVVVYSNNHGDRWIVENRSAGAHTVTVAT